MSGRKRNRKSILPEHPSAPPGIHRIALAEKLLLGGARYSQVKTALIEQFAVAKSTAEQDIQDAQKLIAAELESERPYMLARLVNGLQRVIEGAEADRDWSAAVAANRQIAKLYGLEAPIAVNVAQVSPEQQAMLSALMMTPHERRQRIEELRAEDERDPESN